MSLLAQVTGLLDKGLPVKLVAQHLAVSQDLIQTMAARIGRGQASNLPSACSLTADAVPHPSSNPCAACSVRSLCGAIKPKANRPI